MATVADNAGWGRAVGAGGVFVGGMAGQGSIPDMSPHVETPRFMMKIEGVTSSTVQDFEEAVAIISFTWDVARDISPHPSGHLFSSGTIRGYNTEVIVARSTQVLTMINSLNTGEKIDQIVIDELGIIMQTNVSTTTYTYNLCYFVSAAVVIDPATGIPTNFMRLIFRFDGFRIAFHAYDQEGTALGTNEVAFNFRTGESGGGGEAA